MEIQARLSGVHRGQVQGVVWVPTTLHCYFIFDFFPCQRARNDALIVIGWVTSGAYRLICTGASFVLVTIALRRTRLVCSHAVVSSVMNTASSAGSSVLIILVRLRAVLTVALAFSPSTHMTASLPSPTHIPSCFSISHTLLAMAWFTVSTYLTASHSPRVKVIACFLILPFLHRPRVGQPFGVRTLRFLVISHDVPFPLYSFSFVQFTSQRSESLFRCRSGNLCSGESTFGVNANSIVHVWLVFRNFFSCFRANGVAKSKGKGMLKK